MEGHVSIGGHQKEAVRALAEMVNLKLKILNAEEYSIGIIQVMNSVLKQSGLLLITK